VSAATLFHAAWALVVAHTSGRDEAVFGTVLLGRLQGGGNAQRTLGMLINTLPLRLRLHVTVKELVKQTQRELVELLSHEQASLAEAQRCSGIIGTAPLFSALLNYRHSALDIEDEWDAAGLPIVAGQERTNYPLMLSVDDFGEAFTLTAQTDRRVDPKRILDYTSAALRSLTEALENAPQTLALSLAVLPESERHQVIERFNRTHADYPHEKLIHELFEERVALTPDALAVLDGGQSLTYAELNGKANQLARYLREQGVGPDQLVGICVERSLEMVVGLLGILKAGGAYLPLDPYYPAERLQYMLEDAVPRVVLTQKELPAGVRAPPIEVVALDRKLKEIAGESWDNLARPGQGMTPSHAVYVIYTSGSSGRPKAVVMSHASVVNLIEWHCEYLNANQGQRVLQFAALSFDVAFQDTFSTLCTGGTLVLVNETVRRDARALTDFLGTLQIERLFVPPLMLQALAEHADSSRAPMALKLRDVIVAGEQLRITPEIARFFEQFEGARLHNHYGPTETHVVTSLTLEGNPREWPELVPIGRPISNTRIYILNERQQPVPIGVVGEIHIAGAGLARGYLNRPELTAQRFIPDPFSTACDARMYKTGDLGRWRADGNVEFLGRNDDQVKIRGYRIELGEIQARLAQHAQVKEAVVLAREDVAGEKRLVAYVTCADQCEPGVEELRAHLTALLPEHMVPGAFVVLESLPLTPNGKLDRRALPAPEQDAYASREYEAPQGEVEEILAGIWQELLRVQRVGRRDHFFELGGHSLLIVRLMERLRRVGLSIEVRGVFEIPVLADLASALTRGAAPQVEVPPNGIPLGCRAITPAMLPLVELEADHIARIVQLVPGGAENIQDIYPLAPLQEGLLFHHLLQKQGDDAYVLSTLVSVLSHEQLQAFIGALQEVIDRHDILRTAVHWEELPRPVQVVYRRANLSVQEIALDGQRDAVEQLKERMDSERRLDLRRAPLMKLQTARDAHGASWYGLLQLHHIVCDHESLETMLSEVIACLKGCVQELPPPVAYRNHVAQALAYAARQDVRGFFRSKLGDVEEPTAPFGLLDVRGDGSQIDEAQQDVEPALAKRIRAQARRLGVSAATLFHAAWGLVVAHTSGRDEAVFGTVLLGRLQGSAGAQRILGMFINTLPLRLRLHVTARELVEHTQRELVELLGHEQASLADAQRCSAIAGAAPLFGALLNYRHNTPDVDGDWDAAGIQFVADKDRTSYPITLSVDDMGEALALTAQTDRRIDPQRMLGYLTTALHSLVQALENAPESPALSLPVLPAQEWQQVISLFNQTQAAYPSDKLIHELFEEQADCTPEAVAVLHEEQSLTYEDLNGKANQLARYLRGCGVAPGDLVGICVERSLEMVVGLLAVLKAGGAYVPLDPSYPAERLRYMLEDAAPRVVLTHKTIRNRLSSGAQLVDLDEAMQEILALDDTNLLADKTRASAAPLVFVIYTSGSTGQPKGTAMPHRSMVNLMEWQRRSVGSAAGIRVLQFATLSFDASFHEIFSTLSTGGTLVLVDERVRRDARALIELMRTQRIARLFIPPVMLQTLAEFCESSGNMPEALQDVIAAGEQLRITPEMVSLFKRLPGCRLHNDYGPTETHVVTALTLSGDPEQWPVLPSIGQPIDNTQIYILDGERQPTPIGVAGEIYIGGDALARGYLGKPDLTAQRFLPDPFSTDSQARLYKTGDVGRWHADGTIEFLGRNDDQVKIRGYRIEPGEIEAQLGLHPQVKEVAVVPREVTAVGKSLVAYLIARGDSNPLPGDLRAHLMGLLPEYMVPSLFVVLESLPLTASGKLDRRALPAPEQDAYANREYEAPQGEVEEILAGIWQKLLRVQRVGRRDHFFDLGGHSLIATRVMAHIRHELDVDLPLSLIFEAPTVETLGRHIVQQLADDLSSES
jgi:amino acid adenylation domain-containing protein